MSATAVILVIAGIFLYAGQGFFRKLYSISENGPAAVPLFNIIYGLLVAVVTFVYNGFSLEPDIPTLIFGIVNGIALFLYNISGIEAARTGPYIYQNLISTFGGILVPLACSLIYWKDSLSVLKIAGIVIMLISLVVYNLGNKQEGKMSRIYLVWVALNFLANGIYSAVNDAQQRVEEGTLRNDLIIIIFLTSALITIIYYTIRPVDISSVKDVSLKSWVYALLSSICAAAAVNMLMLTLRYVHSSILYSTQAGGLMITITVLCMVVLREKMGKWQWAGNALALVGIVILNV